MLVQKCVLLPKSIRHNLKCRRPKWMYRVMCTKIITDCFSPCGKALQRRGRTEGSWVFWGLSVDL